MKHLIGISESILKQKTGLKNQFSSLLTEKRDSVTFARNVTSVLSYMALDKYSCVWLDWELLRNDYAKFARNLHKVDPHCPLVTYISDSKIDGQLCGTNDMLFSVLTSDQLTESVPEILSRLKLFTDLKKNMPENLKVNLKPNGFGDFVGNSPHMLEVYNQISRVATTDFTVLILGDSGTGKELVAQSIHENSPRNKNEFVSLNCAAIPEQLLESELFGYEKGAFTGAFQPNMGKFELADKGTIFLDEIGDMSLDLQAKLLRVLEDHKVQRLGSNSSKKVDIRVIAATNMNLEEMIENGKFRADLFHRLNVIPIHLLPLGERSEDVTLIILKSLGKYLSGSSLEVKSIGLDLLYELQDLPLKGNVRELENLLTRIIFYSNGPDIRKAVLEDALIQAPKKKNGNGNNGFPVVFGDKVLPLWNLEKMAIEHAVDILQNNISRVASSLEISRTALYRKMKKFSLDEEKNEVAA